MNQGSEGITFRGEEDLNEKGGSSGAGEAIHAI
jgi:hypothetical protein